MNLGTIWSDAEVKALIAVWGDCKIQEQLDGAVRNKTIFVAISDQLKEQGVERDWNQCRAKVKNLKSEYRSVKDSNNRTGKGRKTCKFFEELDSVLGTGQHQSLLSCLIPLAGLLSPRQLKTATPRRR